MSTIWQLNNGQQKNGLLDDNLEFAEEKDRR